jgi:hypothetical protein
LFEALLADNKDKAATEQSRVTRIVRVMPLG